MILPRETATRQFDGFVCAKVMPDRVDALKNLLSAVNRQAISLMRGDAEPNPVIPFEQLRTIHYARFALLEHDQKAGPVLVFSTNYDGPEGEDACTRPRALEHHIDELVREAEPGLERIFECCKGYQKGQLRRFLKDQKKASTFYVGAPGRSRDQIRWEAELRRDVERVLDENAVAWSGLAPKEVRDAVREKLKDQYPVLPAFPPQPDLTANVRCFQVTLTAVALLVLAGAFYLGWRWLPVPRSFLAGSIWDDIVCLAAIFGIVLTILGVPIAALLAYFRHLEKTDPQFQPVFDKETHQHFSQVSVHENEFLQNQLTHLAYVKPGVLRWLLIRGVFYALQVLATNQYNKGKLGDIPSIHFARWVLLPGRAVLFFSNFDSSWQSYLGDFIDQASSGLTAVWSNTVEYPRTTWLLKSGSRDAARFLAWTRAYQLPTQVWYSAYPGLSVVNVNTNTEIHRGLATPGALDATTWLFHLRSVNRRVADEVFSNERAAEAPMRLKDIQGMILKGYGFCSEVRYLMLRVRPGADLKKVRHFLSRIYLTSADEGSYDNLPEPPLYNAAFTYEGLKAIGLDDHICNAFSTPFVQGSHDEYRALVNGDVGENAPARWRWGGTNETMPHVLVAVFGHKADPEKNITGVDAFADVKLAEAKDAGLDLLVVLEATRNKDRKEHFGFRDGIGQPVVRGSGRVESTGNTIEPGEILLGQTDGYGNITHSPKVDSGFNFGFNGSYLVFRQLKQEVEAFWSYCKSIGGDETVTVAAKMVGRWPSGASLVRHPEKDPDHERFQNENEFTYLGNDWNNDRYGARCPFGAHIRRSNPRDWQLASTPEESQKLSNLHRIIRRGRPYGPPLVDDMDVQKMIDAAADGGSAASGQERGLQFLCFNANIDRQFEFIQQQWCNNPQFAGLTNDADPLLGSGRPLKELGLPDQSFTPQTDVRKELQARHTGMQRFVSVVGSAYFFMPSIPAMKLLDHDEMIARSNTRDLEKLPNDEQLYIESLIDTLREKMKEDYACGTTLRGAHPKMHGCVDATFTVEPDLDMSLRVGIFGQHQRSSSFKAIVRFSNASERVQNDASSDIRGVAIRLLEVEGWKLLDGDERSRNHDFLLVSHDRFFARDVQEFAGFTKALADGTVLRYLLRHPAMALRLMKARGKHSSPLEITYFSMVPYLFGERAVKYKLRPTSPEKTPVPSNPSPNYLCDALWKRLESGPVSFDFMVQVQTEPKVMPVEDATVTWSEKDSPFVKVATLVIPSQRRDDARVSDLERQAEGMTFNPWRCLPAHRPLGGLNRARRQVYRALSSFRNQRNAEVDVTELPRKTEKNGKAPRPPAVS